MPTHSLEERRAALVDRFEKPLLAAAVLGIPTTILEFSSVSQPWPTVGHVLNWIIWLAFVIDLAAMAPRRCGTHATPTRSGPPEVCEDIGGIEHGHRDE